MLIEEKRYRSSVRQWQREIFDLINNLARNDKNYKGFHVLEFEKTSPEDGKMWWDGKEITKEQLLIILQFKCPTT